MKHFEWALKLSRLGSVTIVDNIARIGEVVNAESDDPRIYGVRRFRQIRKPLSWDDAGRRRSLIRKDKGAARDSWPRLCSSRL